MMRPLENVRVLTLALNLPGPLAVARLHEWGATIVKVEPPQGDPLAAAKPDWYRELHEGCKVQRLNLKEKEERSELDHWLDQSDLLITGSRPAALRRLGLSWAEVHAHWPRLSQIAIVGFPAPHEDRPGHDLTYQARAGLLQPPHLPRAMVADLAGAQEVVSAALALILLQARGQGSQYLEVSLAEAAQRFAEPLHRGLTASGEILGGGLPGYELYGTQQGWIAVAALEQRFRDKLQQELKLAALDRDSLREIFLSKTASEWEIWAGERDLPIAALPAT
jgi:crotonobetainyl-CoA:carnitine CoA-transferase CaiB-like acyl-CoA transferase